MPLFSEHISNMYYSGSPSYHTSHKSPSYGYKSSLAPLGTTYSASYLNPGGSYSKHSSLSSYSRAPLTPRWIPGISRSYSPLLTPISERGTSSPIRIHSPRRIPISNRTYGTPSYIQRPININTESIDVSRDRYRPKPAEPPAKASSPPPAPPPVPQVDDPVKHNENSPFMPRVDGKPVTGIDSSPGMPRSTIKRGRTVVRLHTIKRKEKDSPRKPTQEPQSQNSEVNKEAPASSIDNISPEEPESLSWREKLSDDLIYVDKKEKKSLGTKLVEKFIVKDSNENNKAKSDTYSSERASNTVPSSPLPGSDVPSTSKSLDRRCSMELLAEQSCLLDSLIRGENLSTATLDLSKIGITDETKNKFTSSDSIKRRKKDEKGNPLKTTKSDHSLHDTLNSIKKESLLNRDSKTLTKGRSLKKSHSGGSICRLDSITEFPKDAKEQTDLPSIQEDRVSPKETKSDKQSKPKTKITSSVEISPPLSPLKFRIENITVEEKHHTPKKEVSFTYEIDEMSVQDITLQNPKNTLMKTKEQNSIKKESKKISGTDPISPEPDDGNFWAKIGKRETVNLMKRKKNLEEEKEKKKKAFLWYPEDEEVDASNDTVINILSDDNKGSNEGTTLNLPVIPEQTTSPKEIVVNIMDSKEDKLKTISPKLEKSISSDIMAVKNSRPDNSSLEEIKTTPIAETVHDDCVINDSSKKKLIRQDAEIKEETAQISKDNSVNSLDDNLTKDVNEIKQTNISLAETKTSPDKSDQTVVLSQMKNTSNSDITSKVDLNKSLEAKTLTLKPTKSEDGNSSIDENIKIETEKSNNNNLSSNVSQAQTMCELTTNVLQAKSESLEEDLKPVLGNNKKKDGVHSNIGIDLSKNSSTRLEMEHSFTPGLETIIRNKSKNFEKKSKPITAKPETTQSDKDNTAEKSVENVTNPVNTELPQNFNKELKISENIVDKVSSPKTSLTKQTKITSPLTTSQDENKEQHVDKVTTSTDLKTIHSAGNINNIKTESNDKVNKVLTLQTQAKSKMDEKISKSLIKDHAESSKDAKSNASKTIASNSTKSSLQKVEKTETSSKKKINKAETKGLDQKIETKTDKSSSTAKEKICETCKKPVISVDTSKSKNKTTDVKSSVPVVQTTNNVLEVKSVVDSSKINDEDASSSKVIETKNIPNEIVENDKGQVTSQEPTGEENKADKGIDENKDSHEIKVPSTKQVKFSHAKLAKDEKATKPLIATPRPLKKRPPQVIHSDSSDSSSKEESSEEEDSDSEECGEFFECENNPDGRTSTGSNDSGFDSSAPTSPASFLQIKKGDGSPGPSSSNASAQSPDEAGDSELDLEQSTAYGIFRKTGRFTPPAKSIPRFRKYNIEDFQFIKVLGKGSFGKVLLAELRDTEYYYAVKCLKKDVVLEDDDVECTLIERKVLALGTNHPYLCHLFATFQTDSHLFFVMEYLNGGDLMFHIQQSGRFPEARARFYGAEIVSGLKFLHKRGIVYRDLKLDNILLDYEGHVRIADFGMCKLQIYLDKTADTFCGTPDYMAPEIIKGLKYNQTVDWWSFGVLLYEMLIGQSPFSGCDEDELFWSICNEMPSYPRFLSKEALTILTRLLDKDAKTRLGGTDCMHGDVREQDFFYPVHWDRLERREMETPFKPRVRHPLDTQYFDRAFTGERPRLTAVEPHVLRSMDQEPFRGFSYTNPNATDR